LRKIIENAITEYNRYHSPEVKTQLITFGDESFTVEFTGSFCYTCGFYDYFDDYKIALEEKGLKTEISEVIEIDEGAIVKFTILKISSRATRPRVN
jgi:superoxide reductase